MTTYNVYRDGAKVKEGLTATTFTDNGLTPNKSYSYQVSAQNEKGESALSAPITVKTPYSTPTGVTLDKTTLSLEVGSTGSLLASVAPATADQGITWKTSDATIATVDTSGKVSAVKAGIATITAESKGDASKKATCTVTITNPVVSVTGVTVAPTTASIDVGNTQQLTPTVTPANATNKTATYSSGDATIATVSASGLITAVKAGTTTITVTSATDASKKATCNVTVTNPIVAVTGVTLNKTTASIEVGADETITATVAPANATNKAVTYTSSDVAVATVTNAGKITGVTEGTATITVKTTDGNKTAACVATITAP